MPKDGEVALRYLRYDTAIAAEISVEDDGAIRYAFADGPGAFTGDAQQCFLGWLLDLVRWPGAEAAASPEPAPVGVPDPGATLRGVGSSMPSTRTGSITPTLGAGSIPPPTRASASQPVAGMWTAAAEPEDVAPTAEVWSRPSLSPTPDGGRSR